VTALLTAVYMTRMMVMTFWGGERFRESHVDDHHDDEESKAHHGVHEPHESPALMTVPLIVLAVLSTMGGLIGVPYAISSAFGGHPENYIERVLEPVVAVPPGSEQTNAGDSLILLSKPPQEIDGPPAISSLGETVPGGAEQSSDEIRSERMLAAVSVLIAAIGIIAGWIIFKRRPLLELPRILENKYYVDEIYDAAVIEPIKTGSREGLWRFFDVGVIDGIVNGMGRGVREIGALLRYIQPGFVRSYAAIILIGALAVVGYFAYFAYNAVIVSNR
jgi:NADH-quinone oxidoreductase subunit L